MINKGAWFSDSILRMPKSASSWSSNRQGEQDKMTDRQKDQRAGIRFTEPCQLSGPRCGGLELEKKEAGNWHPLSFDAHEIESVSDFVNSLDKKRLTGTVSYEPIRSSPLPIQEGSFTLSGRCAERKRP